MKLFRSLLLTISVILLSSVPCAAGIIVTSSAVAPTSNLIASYDPMSDSNAYFWRWISNSGLGRVEMGPSFFVGGTQDILLDRLTLRAREYGSAVLGEDYRLDIWEFADATDTTGNVLINTQLATLPASGLAAPAYWTFDFDDVLLSAGKQYGILLAFQNGPTADRFVHFSQDFVDGYSGGRLVSRAGTPPDWDFGGHDLTFYVQGSAAVPEPGAFALLAIGAVVTGLPYLKKRRSSQAPA